MKLVLDTNVWLDWLVFADPALSPLRAACEEKRVDIVIDPACEAELERVLAYPLGKWKVDDKEKLLLECRAIAKMLASRENLIGLPRCADPDDQKFLELAAAAGADCLVTKDLELLRLAGRGLPFRIVRPGDLCL